MSVPNCCFWSKPTKIKSWQRRVPKLVLFFSFSKKSTFTRGPQFIVYLKSTLFTPPLPQLKLILCTTFAFFFILIFFFFVSWPAMALGCGTKCAKLLLLIFNTVFWTSGIILFSLGIFFLSESDRSLLFRLFEIEPFKYALPQLLSWSLIVIGIMVFFVGLCGCCGVLKDGKFLLFLVNIASVNRTFVVITDH